MKRQLVTLLFFVGLLAGAVFAQTPTGAEGRWEGTLVVGPNQLRLVVDITKASDGVYLGALTSVDQGGLKIPMDVIRQTGDSVHFEIKAVNGKFDGTLSDDNKKLKGTWNQGAPLPLELTKTSATTETPKPSDAARLSAVTNNPFGIPFEMTVPIAPTPFTGNGKTHLVYELHVTNFAVVEIPMNKLEVLSGGTTIATYEGAELNTMLQRPGSMNLTDNRTIGPGLRAIAYIWITLEPNAIVPTSLRHRITGGSQTVEGPVVPVSTKPITIGPPLRGANWLAANGPANGSVHRRALIPLNGAVHLAQRFAIDWVQIGPNGRTFDGDEKQNKTHSSYGNEILAVADGVVAFTKDGIPENVPGPTSRAVPITPETIGGNHVVLDLGGGHFAFYAHM